MIQQRFKHHAAVALRLVVAGAALLISVSSIAADNQLTSEQKQERLDERDRYEKEARQLCADGKYDEAIAAAEKMLAVEQEVLGTDGQDAIGSRRYLSTLHLDKGDIGGARKMM